MRPSAVTTWSARTLSEVVPELARGEADAAALGEPADGHRRARAGRNRRSGAREALVHVDQPRARADRRDARRTLDGNPGERSEIDEKAVLGRRIARIAVAAGTRADPDPVFPRPEDRLADVGDVRRSDDRKRPDPVEPLVEQHVRLRVRRARAADHRALDAVGQLAEPRVAGAESCGRDGVAGQHEPERAEDEGPAINPQRYGAASAFWRSQAPSTSST